MAKPVIGVMPLWDDEKDSIWMLPGYFDGIIREGGIPLMIPFLENVEDLDRIAGLCDGFLLTGGHDVAPELYNETPLQDNVCCCRKRDEMELFILRSAIENDKPVLGICRGIQFINAALGGTLYQDIPTQYPSDIQHHQEPPYNVPVHGVKIVKDTPLYECLHTDFLQVNSYHHQAVRRIAPGLEEMAISTDGLVEALYMPSHRFLWAVQWHPEFSYETDENSRKIFRSFTEAAGQARPEQIRK